MGSTGGGENLGKMAKNSMKITKLALTFLCQNSMKGGGGGGTWEGQADFLGSWGKPRGNPGWGYTLQSFPEAALPASKPINYLPYLFTVWNDSHLPAAKASLCLEILPISIIIFPICDQWRYFFNLYDKALILKIDFLWFWAAQIPKFDPKNGYGSLWS